MILGPVFHAELLMTARRGRYYVVRTVYGLIILCQVYLLYQVTNGGTWGQEKTLTIRELADFGESIFRNFAILQGVVMLFLTPALVGGTIADERQRKTLHYLLTSRLGGLEIVLGKLAARLLHVGVLVALGLPVVSLIGLFGGVDFRVLLASYAGTLTTVYFVAALSILVSVHSRRPREAIAVLYVYEMIWLFVPTLMIGTMRYWPAPWPTIGDWIKPGLEYLAITSPAHLLTPMAWGALGGLGTALAWMMGLQILFGTIFVAVAAATLRSAARDDGTRRGLAGKVVAFSRKQSWFPRPECGDDAMLWKEKYIARTGGMTKAVMSVLAVGLMGVLAYTMVDFIRPAFVEMWRDGYFNMGSARRDLNMFLRVVCTSVFVLWSLGVASSSASGLTSEREEDTWVSLVATPLTGREILRAKMIGPVWALRPLAYLMFGLWGLGLMVGAVHPLGVMACLAELIVFTWFLTALGTAFSLRSMNSTRALALTMFTLVFLNGGYLFCCIPLRPNTMGIIGGSTPAVFAFSLLSEQNLRESWRNDQGAIMLGSVLGVCFYGALALGLTSWVFESFDAAVDRPDRFRRGMTDAQQEALLKGRPKEILFRDDLS